MRNSIVASACMLNCNENDILILLMIYYLYSNYAPIPAIAIMINLLDAHQEVT